MVVRKSEVPTSKGVRRGATFLVIQRSSLALSIDLWRNPLPPPTNDPLDKLVGEELWRHIVRHVLDPKPVESRTARLLSHPLTNTAVQFILTAVLGGLIALGLQSRSERNKRAEELREVRRTGAEKVFRDVSASMDRRLYWSRRSRVALQTNDQAEISGARLRLDSTIAEWNTNLHTNAAMLCIYFGNPISLDYLKLMSPTMDWYSDLLHSSSDGKRDTAAIEVLDSHLEQAIYALDLQMAERIRTGDLWNEQHRDQCRIPASVSQFLPVRDISQLPH